MNARMQLYKLILQRPSPTGRMGEIHYYTLEHLAVAAGEASGVAFEVKPIWWGG